MELNNIIYVITTFRKFSLAISLMLLAIAGSVVKAAPAITSDFNHDTTGFALTGPHKMLECNECHIRGIFKGLPRRCVACHDRGSVVGSTQKPLNHIVTTDDCEACHSGHTWNVTMFDHSGVSGICVSCHDGFKQTGKPLQGHVSSSDKCDNCHLTVAWIPARVDHRNVSGTCYSCHNGIAATGKHPNHVTTSNNCDDCHSTIAWLPARFDHTGVFNGCNTCHDGVRATGKHPNHIEPAGPACEDCHNTRRWYPADYNHDQITSGCYNCHNNVREEGKPGDHPNTSNTCNSNGCHNTNSWDI